MFCFLHCWFVGQRGQKISHEITKTMLNLGISTGSANYVLKMPAQATRARAHEEEGRPRDTELYSGALFPKPLIAGSRIYWFEFFPMVCYQETWSSHHRTKNIFVWINIYLEFALLAQNLKVGLWFISPAAFYEWGKERDRWSGERKTNVKCREILRHNFSEPTLKLEIERKGEAR